MDKGKSAQIRRALSLKCATQGIPVSGTFELTPRCNLRCKMCYVRMTPEEMRPIGRERTAKEWLEIGRQARDAGMLFLLITGGEPTLRKDFCDIYEGLIQLGLSISINSNGTMFHQELRELLHRLPPAQINITLYGTTREEYAALCGDPNAYERVIDTLDWLQKNGFLVHLNATMIPENKEKWEAFEDFAKNRGLELRMTTYCFPPTRKGLDRKVDRLSPEEAADLAIKDILYREGIEAIYGKKKNQQNQISSCKLDIGDPMQCMAAKSQFWINWDGTMVPCGMLNTPVTNPFEMGFESAWECLKEEAAKIRLCPDCTGCAEKKNCMNCAAVTYTETGSFDGKPEYMCQLNRAYQERLDRYSEM